MRSWDHQLWRRTLMSGVCFTTMFPRASCWKWVVVDGVGSIHRHIQCRLSIDALALNLLAAKAYRCTTWRRAFAIRDVDGRSSVG